MTFSSTTMTVASGYTLSIGGDLDVSASNLTIKSSPGQGENYFYVGESGASPTKYIKYTQGGALEVKGDIKADTLTINGTAAAAWLSAQMATIGGWTIGTNKIYSNSGTTYVALDSGTTNEEYAIWAGNETSSSANFRVKRNGDVYLNSLMILD